MSYPSMAKLLSRTYTVSSYVVGEGNNRQEASGFEQQEGYSALLRQRQTTHIDKDAP